jgi:subtilase family serine protease
MDYIFRPCLVLLFKNPIKEGVELMRFKIFMSIGIIFLLSSVIAIAAVDLKFTTAISQAPDPAIAGNAVTFTVSFKNFGGAVDNMKITGGVDGAGIFERLYAHINTDLQRTDSFTWTATAGTHTIWFELDPEHVQGDSDYSNNRIEKQITISSSQNPNMPNIIHIKPNSGDSPTMSHDFPLLSKPNLKIEVAYNSEGLKCGGKVNFYIKVKNTGNAATPSGFEYHIYNLGNLVSIVPCSPLEAGGVIALESGDAMLLCDTNCTSTWKFIIDPTDYVSESDENDNTKTLTLNGTCVEDQN